MAQLRRGPEPRTVSPTDPSIGVRAAAELVLSLGRCAVLVEVWCKDSGWRVTREGAIIADGLSRDAALRAATRFAEHGQVLQLLVHEPEHHAPAASARLAPAVADPVLD